MEPIEINGRYRLDSVIGEGGMGAVYRGVNIALGRPVAVKLVHAIHATNPQIVGRLKQEARATAAIVSDHVVQVLDAGEDPKAGLFLVMELLAGEDLDHKLMRERRLSPADAISIADQVARGLGHAHVRGVIHRDLKPANVFLCDRPDGDDASQRGPVVKLVDFGIAKLVRDSALALDPQFRDAQLTFGGCVVGTPQYMSPEQAQGFAIDARTDVYSLGALLFEMLVGEPPVPDFANYEQKILHIVTKPRPRLREVMPNVHPALDRLVADMLASDREQRPSDMRAVRERLARLDRASYDAPRLSAISEPPPAPPLTRPGRENTTWLGWGAAALAAVAIGIVGMRALVQAAPASKRVVNSARFLAPTELVSTGPTSLRARPAVTVSWVAPSPPMSSPKPRATPIAMVAPPTAAPVLAERPFGGTGISQEF